MQAQSSPNISVYCFTRDSPETLHKSLRALQKDTSHSRYARPQIIVLDDSQEHHNRRRIRLMAGEFSGKALIYHGALEQRKLLHALCSQGAGTHSALRRFIRPLGHRRWDLGAVRNYALLLHLSRAGSTGKIIFIDDDILLTKPLTAGSSSLWALMSPLQNDVRSISGGHLFGNPDCSLIERIYLAPGHSGHTVQKLASHDRVPISGGLMAFDSSWGKRFHFPRTYDEDWFWITYCQMFGARITLSNARGIHCRGSSGNASNERIAREQTGEAFFEGLRWAVASYRNRSSIYRSLRSTAYWRGVLRDETAYLRALLVNFRRCPKCAQRLASISDGNVRVIQRAHIIVSNFAPEDLAARATDYLSDLPLWQKLCLNVSAQRA